MKPAPFHYARPHSVSDALGLLRAHGRGATLLAGGQTLMPLMARRSVRPAWVIDINRIEGLDRIELTPTHVRMGALVRQETARRSAIARAQIPGVTEALSWVATAGIRRRGTVVGNLVTNAAATELPAVALALDALFVVRHPEGEETVAAAALLGPGCAVPGGALVTHVLWPRMPGPAGFYEVARRDGHAPVVSALVCASGGDWRVALSGVRATGLSCPTTAGVIARHFPHPPAVEVLADALRGDLVGPVHADAYSSAAYRVGVAPAVIAHAAERMARSARTP